MEKEVKGYVLPLIVFFGFFGIFCVLESLHRPDGNGEVRVRASGGDNYLTVYEEAAPEEYEAYESDPTPSQESAFHPIEAKEFSQLPLKSVEVEAHDLSEDE